MKGREGKAIEHLVPLSSAAQEIIASLPRIKNGPFLFSFNAGKRPLKMSGPMKASLDKRMLRTLRALARRRGEDPHAVDLAHWQNHDLRPRRTAGEWRSMIARGVDPAVIESVRRAAEARERALRIRHSFATVAEAFIGARCALDCRNSASRTTSLKLCSHTGHPASSALTTSINSRMRSARRWRRGRSTLRRSPVLPRLPKSSSC
jgi:hypothetical protein